MSLLQTNVFLYGSCVSRDTAEFRTNRWNILEYVARQSMISAFAPPMTMPAGSLLTSGFQNSSLRGDFESSLLQLVRHEAEKIDRFVIDLVDERLGVYPFANGGYLSFTNELNLSGLLPKLEGRGPLIEFGSDAHFILWRTALEKLLGELQSMNLFSKVRVIRAPFVDRTFEGEEVDLTRGINANSWNNLYRRYYDAMFESGVKIVDIGYKSQFSSSKHKWGPAQYHYKDSAYEDLATQIEER